MMRDYLIIMHFGVVLFLGGCGERQREPEAIWQGVKISDLASPSDDGKIAGQRLKTLNFSIYTFEIPAKNIRQLDDIWLILDSKPLIFNDYSTFSANLFSATSGPIRLWPDVREILAKAGAEKTESLSLLMFESQADDFTFARLANARTIFHMTSGGTMEGSSVSAGVFNLRLEAKKAIDIRGVCNLQVTPVFSQYSPSAVRSSGGGQLPGETVFSSMGFSSKMSPGDFIILWPEQYSDNEVTISGYLFGTGGKKKVFRAYLIVCASVGE